MFKAPSGNELKGAVQDGGQDIWRVVFDDNSPTQAKFDDYVVSAGPDSPDWETVTIDGAELFEDDGLDRWLIHHLVPEEFEPLTGSTLALMREELALGLALEAARQLHDATAKLPKAHLVRLRFDRSGILEDIESEYKAAKSAAAVARAVEMAHQIKEGLRNA